jgi:hypothetical protein
MTPSSPVAQPAKDCFALLRQSRANDDTLVSAVSTQLWNPRKEKRWAANRTAQRSRPARVRHVADIIAGIHCKHNQTSKVGTKLPSGSVVLPISPGTQCLKRVPSAVPCWVVVGQLTCNQLSYTHNLGLAQFIFICEKHWNHHSEFDMPTTCWWFRNV